MRGFRLATRDLNGPGVEVGVLAVQSQQPATHGIVGVLGVVEYIHYLRLEVHSHQEQLYNTFPDCQNNQSLLSSHLDDHFESYCKRMVRNELSSKLCT